ncbi:WD REPEATS REGION domain-containing protein [Citrus sinensis]|nr:WD REPEATS REGION domain-containing protein [Citrus sinensis]
MPANKCTDLMREEKTLILQTSKNSHIFAVSDEDGYVSLFDSRRKLPSFACHQENAEKARISDWVAHQNAIFDLCWIKEDTNILTASGDQTVNILVSGSRDGSFAIWDLRCKSSPKSNCAESFVFSSAVVKGAHLLSQSKRVSRRKAASMSITSVLYLKDEVSIATASAVNSIVKFWDTRNLKAQITQACPHAESSSAKETRLHGISSLSQDSNGVFLTASCMDHRIYLYNVLQLDKGPIQHFSGCRIESFYVKSEICPNASHILSGSSDGNAYVWQVNKPQADPIKLKSHDGEVTAVNWCPNEAGKIVTSSDDYTVRLWSLENSRCSSMRSPSSVRRRVMAIPSTECRKLFMNGEPGWLAKGSDRSYNSDDVLNQINSSDPKNMPIIRTPEAQKKKIPSFDTKEAFEKTPEASLNSPSSVLNPPSSVKRRTIRDYFLVTP